MSYSFIVLCFVLKFATKWLLWNSWVLIIHQLVASHINTQYDTVATSRFYNHFSCDLHTVAPGPLERTCWRQFAALWGDCKKSRIAPLNVIIIIIIIIIIITFNAKEMHKISFPRLFLIQNRSVTKGSMIWGVLVLQRNGEFPVNSVNILAWLLCAVLFVCGCQQTQTVCSGRDKVTLT